MSTRCLTIFKNELGEEICVLYRHSDGDPSGHGKELKEFLNGYGTTKKPTGAFNGMGCLAAQVVAHFKKGVGNFYLYPPGTRGFDEEYIYTIRCTKKGRILLKVSEADGEYSDSRNQLIREV